MEEKLDNKHATDPIKQTRNKREIMSFRDSAIEKISIKNLNFGSKRFRQFKFNVSKGSSLKGLLLRVSKSGRKDFIMDIWFSGKTNHYTIGQFPHIKCKDVEKICLDLADTHQDERGLWIKSPVQTKIDEKRLVDKPDTTLTAGKSLNDVIEDYCKGGFEKDNKVGSRTSKSCQIWFRYMAGYNNRQLLVEFENDDNGEAVATFKPNKHLRINAPRDWQDLFRKYPPGRGVKKDRQYYNRRKKRTYTITASINKAIYDSDLGKSLIEDLKPGDIEHWLKDVSSGTIKENYLKVFISLWIWARKKGWLGTNPGACPISLKTVYIKKELKKSDPYKDVAIEDLNILDIFWESCEELSEDFPWVAELHQFLLTTSIRKTEAMQYKKEYINWEQMTYVVPKGVSKNRKLDKVQPITPELEILFRNILSIGERPGLEYYKMKDHPWLFGTTKWSENKYFSKDHKKSHKSHLGSDETFTPRLRALMRYKAEDPNLLYAPKILRKSYITLSQKVHNGRSDITALTSRHEDLSQIGRSYNKPGIETRRVWASEVSKVFTFVKKRTGT
jgi:integrase|tara:strand:+ start:1829 stop:3505 length:1677 start_codon:yes stop_codon:yes gene_type:complete